jgi:hypothetical protein
MTQPKENPMPQLDPDQLTTMLTALEEQQTILHHSPCRFRDRHGDQSCLEPRPGEGVSWRDMDPDRMCMECRAYWYLSNATDTLRRCRADQLAQAAARALEAERVTP